MIISLRLRIEAEETKLWLKGKGWGDMFVPTSNGGAVGLDRNQLPPEPGGLPYEPPRSIAPADGFQFRLDIQF